MKNTLKNKLLGGISVLSIAGSIFFGSLAACTETESDSADFPKYSVVKMTDNYVLHRNIKKYSSHDNGIDTKCGLHLSWSKYGIYVRSPSDSEFMYGPEFAIYSELYLGKTLEELEKNHIEYTDVCEECFPDGIEAE